jgi:hypothetical protein
MSDRKTRIVLADFSGGRNGIDSPLGPEFAANQVTDAVNGDWYHTSGAEAQWLVGSEHDQRGVCRAGVVAGAACPGDG